MTKQLYERDAYLRAFEASVTAVDTELAAVELDATAFYPLGGGQPSDQGVLRTAYGDLPVTSVARQGGRLWHTVQGELPVVGAAVDGVIDWDLRYKNMRTHTAMHILCGVVWRDYGAQVTGGSMSTLKGRMDFEFEMMRAELVREIEERVNAEVAAQRDIRITILPRQEAFEIPDLIRTKINLLPPAIRHVRTVEIVGLDLQADGGTHVANTREVGPIRIPSYKSKGRINKRIYVELE